MTEEKIEIESKMRSLRSRVKENSEILERIVDSIVSRYNKDLHEFIKYAKDLVERPDELTEHEIENLVLKIPIYMYFASAGLESLGIEGDNAKAVKMEAFNKIYVDIEGTIQDKTKAAELETFPEYLTEVAFTRAYRKLKNQIENAEHVFSGAKKVLSKRMLELELGLRQLGYHRKDKEED